MIERERSKGRNKTHTGATSVWTKGWRRERGKQMGGGGVKGGVHVCVRKFEIAIERERDETFLERQRTTERDTRKWSW